MAWRGSNGALFTWAVAMTGFKPSLGLAELGQQPQPLLPPPSWVFTLAWCAKDEGGG